MTEQIKKGTINIGKYKVGLPVISDSYKAKTPKKIKIASETLVLVGSSITLLAACFTPPGWVIAIGGIATLGGRYLLKCFSE